jgi:hypothetical protein
MNYELLFDIDIVIVIILLIYFCYKVYRRYFTIGRHGIFQFRNKRKSTVTLSLNFLSAPKNFSEKKRLVRAFFSTIRYLHINGYEKVNFRTHLLKKNRNISLKNILANNGYVITKMYSLRTSLKDKLINRLSIYICSGEKRKINKDSWDVTIKLK